MNITTQKNTFNTEVTMDEKAKVVRNSRLARKILNVGGKDVRIIDIKPSREDPKSSVFVFLDDDKFQEVFAKVLEDYKKPRDDESDTKIRDLEKKIEELQKAIAAKEG